MRLAPGKLMFILAILLIFLKFEVVTATPQIKLQPPTLTGCVISHSKLMYLHTLQLQPSNYSHGMQCKNPLDNNISKDISLVVGTLISDELPDLSLINDAIITINNSDTANKVKEQASQDKVIITPEIANKSDNSQKNIIVVKPTTTGLGTGSVTEVYINASNGVVEKVNDKTIGEDDRKKIQLPSDTDGQNFINEVLSATDEGLEVANKIVNDLGNRVENNPNGLPVPGAPGTTGQTGTPGQHNPPPTTPPPPVPPVVNNGNGQGDFYREVQDIYQHQLPGMPPNIPNHK